MNTENNQVLMRNRTDIQVDDAMLLAFSLQQKRGHLGMSGVASENMRETWMKFRWCLPDEFTARTLRIFELGHAIEKLIIQDLCKVPGVVFHDVNPKSGLQFNFKFLGGHFAGSMDGCVVGIPEAPRTWHVFEAKSAKDDEFKLLKKAGSYEAWNPTYYGQIQCYMGASGMSVAIVGVYNKDTSEIYWERVKAKPGFWENAQIIAQDLLEVQGPPSAPPEYTRKFYKIANWKSDKYQRIYWGDELPAPHCRNCKHSQVMFDGDAKWHCTRYKKDLTRKQQAAGCDYHLYLPALMPATKIENQGDVVRYKTRDKSPLEFWNSEDLSGASDQHIYSSKQLHALSEGDGITRALMDDEVLNQLLAAVDGEIVSPSHI